MKYKGIRKIILGLFLLMGLNNIYASNLNIILSSQEVEIGNSFKISVNSSADVTDFEVSVNNDILGTPKVVGNYTGSTTSTNGTRKIVKFFQFDAQQNKKAIKAGTNLATFEFVTLSNSKLEDVVINVTIKAIDINGNQLTETLSKTVKLIKKKSTNCDLSSIRVNGKTVKGFDANTTKYTLPSVENDVSTIEVTATTLDSKAKLTGTGTIKLKEGKNTIKVNVVAESGATKTYVLTITRNSKNLKSNECYLKNIKVDGKNIDNFDENKLEYTIGKVEHNVSSLLIEATAKNHKATINGLGEKELQVGKNKIKIVVSAEDGTQMTYVINVEREQQKNIQEVTAEVNGNIEKYNYYIRIIVLIVIIICIIVVIIKFIIERRKKNE